MKLWENIIAAYRGKRVLVTGHTGFKGSWLCRILYAAGAEVFGYALAAEQQSMFRLCSNERILTHFEGDVRCFSRLKEMYESVRPQFVFHLAAQPLVLEGYRFPRETYETNLMGTVNLLECVRLSAGAESVLIVTTDKVYAESARIRKEGDRLDGADPYSNSKSCAELAAACYRRSYAGFPALSTVRAGNAIGGGDCAADRILPDCVRAALAQKPVVLRHPRSVRPYQYVLDVLSAYLLLAAEQAEHPHLASAYNVAPPRGTSTASLAKMFSRAWGGLRIAGEEEDFSPAESRRLCINGEKLAKLFPDLPHTPLRDAVAETVSWEKARAAGKEMGAFTDRQIASYFSEERRA